MPYICSLSRTNSSIYKETKESKNKWINEAIDRIVWHFYCNTYLNLLSNLIWTISSYFFLLTNYLIDLFQHYSYPVTLNYFTVIFFHDKLWLIKYKQALKDTFW